MVDVEQSRRKEQQGQKIICFDLFKDSLISAGNMVIPIALGADEHGNPVLTDLVRCPHLLVGGQTGSGKTAFLDSIVCSIISSRTPDEAKLAIVDLKGAEFPIYNGIPHLLCPVITDAKRVFGLLDDVIIEIDRRLLLFSKAGVRRIGEYNQKICKLPHIIVIVDEYSTLMPKTGKKFEDYIGRIAPVAGLCGIHLVLSTNRCYADVITGVMKCCFSVQVAFSVPSGINSRIIMDCVGAETISEYGEMLFMGKGMKVPIKLQGVYLADLEIKALVDLCKENY